MIMYLKKLIFWSMFWYILLFDALFWVMPAALLSPEQEQCSDVVKIVNQANSDFWQGEELKKKNDQKGAIILFNKALDGYKKAVPLLRAMGARDKEAEIINAMGFTYSTGLNEGTKALEFYTEALKIRRDIGDKAGEVVVLSHMGVAYGNIGEKLQELHCYETALPLVQELGDRVGEGTIYQNIGATYYDLGNKEQTLVYFEKALPISEAIGDKARQVNMLNTCGKFYLELGKKVKALASFKKMLPLLQEMGNHFSEATILNNMGSIYNDLGYTQDARVCFEKGLPISQATGNRATEAELLTNMGKLFSNLSQQQEALWYYEKSLPLFQSMGDRIGEAITLNSIGAAYNDLGLSQKALEYLNKALPIFQAVGNRVEEAILLNNIGELNRVLGLYPKALEYFEKSLIIKQNIGNRANTAATLSNLGVISRELGQKQKALKYFKQVLFFSQSRGDRRMEAGVLNNLGILYADMGEWGKVFGCLERALNAAKIMGDRANEAVTLNNLATFYSLQGEKEKALEYFSRALPISQETGDRSVEATTVNNLGYLYVTLGQKEKALEYYERALLIYMAIENGYGETVVPSNIMDLMNDLGEKHLAIFYGKQAVNGYQKIRSTILKLPVETKQNYVKSKKETYQLLADLLITSGALAQAQQVLDMFKEEEFFDFIRRDGYSAENLTTTVDYTPFEKQWIENQGPILKKMCILNSEYQTLKFTKNKTEIETKRLAILEMELKKNEDEYRSFLTRLKKAFSDRENAIRHERDSVVLDTKAKALQEILAFLDKNETGRNASLHYLIYNGRISVILTTPTSQLLKQTEINETKLNQKILQYRNMIVKLETITRGVNRLETDGNRVATLFQKKQEYEKTLYDIIFKPVDEELKKNGITNVLLSLYGVLRYIPMPSLWDGENYLVQRYRITQITPSSLRDIKEAGVEKKKILAMGASLGGNGYSPLPYVRREIRGIVLDKKNGFDGLIEGEALLDAEFTRENMKERLQKRFPLVHISSHFQFSPGDETKNHLFLGDGSTMKLSEMRGLGKLFDGVKLLVLSACQTGVGGNGEEIDGFAELSQCMGAQSVVASLWPVADESTQELMVHFYRMIKEGKVSNKIEALRQAQLELAGLEDLLDTGKEDGKPTPKKRSKHASSYFWGPFILMGNWR